MQDKIIPVDDVTASTHDDGLVLFHRNEGRLFAANRAGADVWRGLEQHRSIADIAAEMSTTYGVTFATTKTEIEAFVHELQAQRLATRSTVR